MHDVFRDGKVYVCAEMCPTCVFRPGNLMDLNPGRLKGMIQETRRRTGGVIPCHERLRTWGYEDGDAICRGFFDREIKRGHSLLQIAERLDMLEFEEPRPKVAPKSKPSS